MRMTGAILWRLISLLGWAASLAALGADDDSAGQYYTVKVWGADDGLTEGSVTDVAQTPGGIFVGRHSLWQRAAV